MPIPPTGNTRSYKGRKAVATISDHQQTPEKTGTEQIEGRVPAVEEAGTASLDKVRDILFGGQMRDLDRRFARVEERLTRETLELKDDMRKRLATLEQFARTETESLAQRNKTEHDARIEATSALRQQLHEASSTFDKKLALIDDELARARREFRQQVLEVQQQLVDEIREKTDAVLARLSRESEDLRADKADRVTLAALFTEIAMRLTHDPAVSPEQEPPRE